jgi:hypothetical protein
MCMCVCCRLCRCVDLASTTAIQKLNSSPWSAHVKQRTFLLQPLITLSIKRQQLPPFHQYTLAAHLYSIFNMPLRQSYSDHVRFSRQFLFISPLVFHHRIESRKSSTPGRSGCSLRIFTGKLCVTIRCVNVLLYMRHSICLAHT